MLWLLQTYRGTTLIILDKTQKNYLDYQQRLLLSSLSFSQTNRDSLCSEPLGAGGGMTQLLLWPPPLELCWVRPEASTAGSHPRPTINYSLATTYFTKNYGALQSTGGKASQAYVFPFRTVISSSPRVGSEMLPGRQWLESKTLEVYFVFYCTVVELALKPQDAVLPTHSQRQRSLTLWPLPPQAHGEYCQTTANIPLGPEVSLVSLA